VTEEEDDYDGPDQFDFDQAFIQMVREECKRVLYCAPSEVATLMGMVVEHGWAGTIEVRPSVWITDPQRVLVVDENAISAAINQSVQKKGGA